MPIAPPAGNHRSVAASLNNLLRHRAEDARSRHANVGVFVACTAANALHEVSELFVAVAKPMLSVDRLLG